MPKQLQFEDVKKAALNQAIGERWDVVRCCKAVYGAVSWPGKRPGFIVIVAMDPARHFDSHDIYLLEEFESSSVRDLVRQCDVLDFKYSPERFIGDWKNDATDHFIRELND